MSFGEELTKNFGIQVSRTSEQVRTDEVVLFRCLIDAFISMPSYRVAEIHGTRHQVEYDEIENWFIKRPRCELGDILVIVFSVIKRRGRLLIIQNKVSRVLRGPRNSKRPLSSDCRSLSASLAQYELLRDRPVFTNVSGPRKGRKSTLIQLSPCPSVCQYGLFYNNASGHVDMSSMTAEELVFSASAARRKFPVKSGKYRRKITFSPSNSFETFHCRSPKGDFVGAENLKDFGDLLDDLYIGRPIDGGLKCEILRDFKDYLSLGGGGVSPLAEQLISEFNETDFVEDIRPSGDRNEMSGNIFNTCRTLLLINADISESDCSGCSENSQMLNAQREI